MEDDEEEEVKGTSGPTYKGGVKASYFDDDDDDPKRSWKNLGVCCGPRQGGVGRPPGDSGRALGGPSGPTEGPRRVSISDP